MWKGEKKKKVINKIRNIHFTDWKHQIILFIVGVLNVQRMIEIKHVPGL